MNNFFYEIETLLGQKPAKGKEEKSPFEETLSSLFSREMAFELQSILKNTSKHLYIPPLLSLLSKKNVDLLNYNHGVLLRQISKIKDPVKKFYIAAHAQFLFTTDMSEYDRLFIIKTCLTLTPDQIGARAKTIPESSTHLFTESMDGLNRSFIIEACLTLIPDQIRMIFESSHYLFKADMGGYYCSCIIKACLTLTPDQIKARAKAISESSMYLFSEDMNIRSRTYIIENCFLTLCPDQIKARSKAIRFYHPHLFLEDGTWEPLIAIRYYLSLEVDTIRKIAEG